MAQEVKATAKYIRIAPRKVRIVMNLVCGKSVADALAILKFTPKVGADAVEKVLRSAVANAENNFEMDPDNLYVAEAYATAGPILKRGRPRAQGRMYRINKRTSHITVVVANKEGNR